jgi:hypothetical protein
MLDIILFAKVEKIKKLLNFNILVALVRGHIVIENMQKRMMHPCLTAEGRQARAGAITKPNLLRTCLPQAGSTRRLYFIKFIFPSLCATYGGIKKDILMKFKQFLRNCLNFN